jgi:hypothetical protein
MTQPVTKAMVEAYQDEHNCSLAEAMQVLKRRQKLANHAQLLVRAEEAKTFDQLKAIVVELVKATYP